MDHLIHAESLSSQLFGVGNVDKPNIAVSLAFCLLCIYSVFLVDGKFSRKEKEG